MNAVFTRSLLPIMALGLLSSCVSSTSKQDIGAREPLYPSDLNKNGAEYDGKEILVRGFLFEDADLICLVDKKITNKNEIAKEGAITVLGLEKLRPIRKDYAGMELSFVARYSSDLLGPGVVLMAGCGQRGVRIENIQKPF